MVSLIRKLCSFPHKIECSFFHTWIPFFGHASVLFFLSMQVGVCIDNDARKMFNDYDVRVQPLMDLSPIANAKLAGPQRRWSLAALTEMITSKEVIPIVLALKYSSVCPFQLASERNMIIQDFTHFLAFYVSTIMHGWPNGTSQLLFSRQNT